MSQGTPAVNVGWRGRSIRFVSAVGARAIAVGESSVSRRVDRGGILEGLSRFPGAGGRMGHRDDHRVVGDVSSPGLARRLGVGDATVIGLGSMIGAGVFSAFGPAARAAGAGLLGGW